MPQPGDPQSLNRYSYANNSPIVYNDPSGHEAPPFKELSINLPSWVTSKPKLMKGLAVGCFFLSCHVDQENGVLSGPTAEEQANMVVSVGPATAMSMSGTAISNELVEDIASKLTRIGLEDTGAKQLIKQLAEYSTKNSSAEAEYVALGSFREYIDIGKLEGMIYFDMPTPVWNTLREAGDDYVWSVNKQFLDDAIKAGKEFVVVLGEGKQPGVYLKKEIEYLIKNGYELINGVYMPGG